MLSFDNTLKVFSAGTEPTEKINEKAVAVMKELGIDISGAYPKNVKQYTNKEWDYVIRYVEVLMKTVRSLMER